MAMARGRERRDRSTMHGDGDRRPSIVRTIDTREPVASIEAATALLRTPCAMEPIVASLPKTARIAVAMLLAIRTRRGHGEAHEPSRQQDLSSW